MDDLNVALARRRPTIVCGGSGAGIRVPKSQQSWAQLRALR
jgi:hypothetical protein